MTSRMPPRSRGWHPGLVVLVLIIVFTAAVAVVVPRPTAQALPRGHRVVVLGGSGLEWSHVSVSRTPVLQDALVTGYAANLSVRTQQPTTCALDGWLSLGAGTRVSSRPIGSSLAGPAGGDGGATSGAPVRPAAGATTGSSVGCDALPTVSSGVVGPGGSGTISGWSGLVNTVTGQAATRTATLGALAEQARAAGECIAAVGPGAALAAAAPDGTVTSYRSSEDATLRAAVEAARSACPVTVVDLGTMPPNPTAADLTAYDTRYAQASAATNPDDLVITATLADGNSGRALRPMALTLDHGAGLVRSSSTRRDGLATLPDLSATIAAARGWTLPGGFTGAPLRTVPLDDSGQGLAGLRSQAAHAVVGASALGPFYLVVVAAWALALLATFVAWRADRDLVARLGARQVGRIIALLGLGVPGAAYLMNLAPWWRSPWPLGAALLLTALTTTALTVNALVGPGRNLPVAPATIVVALTAVIIVADVLSGSPMLLSGPFGEDPTIGGRFYGLGNPAFAVFATAAVLSAVGMASAELASGRGRRRVLLIVTLVGLIAVAIDGAPWWGADLGGPVALIPAFAVLAIGLGGVRATWRRLVAVVAATVGVVVALAVGDYLRPVASRTHLGRFVASLLDGSAADTIARKAGQNWELLTASPLGWAVPVGLLFLGWVVWRRPAFFSWAFGPAARECRIGWLAVWVLWVVGFLTNDTGVAIPAAGSLVAIPFFTAIALRRLRAPDLLRP